MVYTITGLQQREEQGKEINLFVMNVKMPPGMGILAAFLFPASGKHLLKIVIEPKPDGILQL